MSPMHGQSASPFEIRKEHIGHEASIRGVALLYYFVSVFIGLGSLGFLFLAVSQETSRLRFLILTAFLLGLAVLYAVLARGIRRLKPWSRTPATVLACIGLLGFPLGTLINGYILYLLHSERGKTIFSPEYQQVVLQTPEVRYKTPLVLWILLILVISLFLIGMIAAAWTIDWTAHASQTHTPFGSLS